MIKEYGGKEKYPNKAAMKKHESKEGSKKEKSEEKGEMGRPSNKKSFDEAMQKEWESRKQGAPGKTTPETRKEAEAREMGKRKEVEKKQSVNSPSKPRLMTAIERAGIKLKKMY